ncbi:GNAT family N-acetyltransferase [Streptomyces sp. NPDC046237]|uniref:GNAT family N-acetyltransferase n=1 Tax=Streptomyces sp. NPDC046237 TaxID=3154914 RepID=UPI0033F2C759
MIRARTARWTSRNSPARVLVAPDARRHGHGAAWLTQVLAFPFAQLGLERVELVVVAHNGQVVRLNPVLRP